jgi:hypothetical protein
MYIMQEPGKANSLQLALSIIKVGKDHIASKLADSSIIPVLRLEIMTFHKQIPALRHLQVPNSKAYCSAFKSIYFRSVCMSFTMIASRINFKSFLYPVSRLSKQLAISNASVFF